MTTRIVKNLLINLGLMLSLAGCGDLGDDKEDTSTVKVDKDVTVTLESDALSVGFGDSVTLTWSSEEADSCQASGDWSGSRETSGAEVIGSLTTNSTFSLSCTGSGGTAVDTVNVSVSTPVSTAVSLSASPTSVSYSGSTTLTWNSSNATNCVASGDWTGGKALSGSETINAMTSSSTFNLSCTGTGADASDSVNVIVAAPVAPSVNLSANPSNLPFGGSTTLSWNSNNATSCTASGGWSGNRASSGSATITNLDSNTRFDLSCSGPGGSANDSILVTVAAPPAPQVNVSASPSSVIQNGSTTISWSATNADSCTASGAWSGSKATAGTEIISGLSATSAFDLSCSGPGGSDSDSIVVTVAAPPAPTVSLSASPSSVSQNGSTTLSWNTTNADSCTASDDWAGGKPVSGSETISSISTDSLYTLVCTGAGGTGSDAVSIMVVTVSNGTALLSWLPPTQNADGSPLTDLAGFRIYYGTSSGNYSDSITLNNAGLSSYLVENLAPATWYFSMTAFNSSGLESQFTIEVSKLIN